MDGLIDLDGQNMCAIGQMDKRVIKEMTNARNAMNLIYSLFDRSFFIVERLYSRLQFA